MFVVGQDAGHAFPITIDAIGTNGFRLVDPQLAEIDGTSVEVRHIGNHEFAFALPTGYWHAATDDSTVALNGQTTVLRTERDGFRDAMDA